METLQEDATLIDTIIQYGTQLSHPLGPDDGVGAHNGATTILPTSSMSGDH